MSRLAPILLLAGCSVGPFENDPPRLVSVNGVENHRIFGLPDFEPALRVVPGEDFEIRLVVEDPEGRDVRAWWPWGPAGLDFDPDATTGVWHVPAEPEPFYGFSLLLEDTHPRDPRVAELWVPLWTAWDTGDPADTAGTAE